MGLISPLKLNISKRLKEDNAFRKRFFRRQAQDEIAMSIRSLREKRVMRQIDLAKKSGMKQSAISRIEQADYSGWSFNTLLRVGEALDARLHVTLEPKETVIARYENQGAIATLQAGWNCVVHVPQTILEAREVTFSGSVASGEIMFGTIMGWYQLTGRVEILMDTSPEPANTLFPINREFKRTIQITAIASYTGRLSYGDETSRKEHRTERTREEPSYPNQVACV